MLSHNNTGMENFTNMSLDLKIFYFFNNLAGQNKWLDYLFIFLAEYLEYFIVFGLLLMILRLKKYNYKEKIRLTVFCIGSAIIARFAVAEAIRFFLHRPRPFLEYAVNQLVYESSYSFPSGHAIFFTALATAAHLVNKKSSLIFFTAAILISLARIITGVHWPSDIAAGFVLGILTALGCKKLMDYLTKPQKKEG